MNWAAIQAQLQTWCEQYPELLAVYLFGSQAEGRAGYFEPEYVQAMTGMVSFRNGTLTQNVCISICKRT